MDQVWRNGVAGRGIALAIALSASLSTAQAIRTTHAPGVDFSKYHTYQWVEIKGQHPDPNVDAQIKLSIDSDWQPKVKKRQPKLQI